jgi:ribosomal protein S18 acetylase RimI-like enzyme
MKQSCAEGLSLEDCACLMKDEQFISRSEELGSIQLRDEQSGDEPLLFELYASTREEELALTGWDSATRQAFLNMQFRAMRQGYRSMFPEGQFSIIVAAGLAVGRVAIARLPLELHLVDIVVLAAHRSRGIGERVMKVLMTEAIATGKPVRLQVLKQSRAIAFYRRLGFSKMSENQIYDQMEWCPPPQPGRSDVTRLERAD